MKNETRGSGLLFSDTPHHFNKHIRINLWQCNRLFLSYTEIELNSSHFTTDDVCPE